MQQPRHADSHELSAVKFGRGRYCGGSIFRSAFSFWQLLRTPDRNTGICPLQGTHWYALKLGRFAGFRLYSCFRGSRTVLRSSTSTSFRHKITTRKLRQIVPACWIIAIIHIIPVLVYKSVDVSDPEKNVCRTTFGEHWHYVTHDLLWLMSGGIIPTVVMAVLYSRVLYILWMTDNGNATNLAVIKARKRITQTSITVSIIYALCVVPVGTVYLLLTLYPETFSLHDAFFEGATCLVVLNSTVNPFVYTFQCKKFRKYFKRLLCRSSTTVFAS